MPAPFVFSTTHCELVGDLAAFRNIPVGSGLAGEYTYDCTIWISSHLKICGFPVKWWELKTARRASAPVSSVRRNRVIRLYITRTHQGQKERTYSARLVWKGTLSVRKIVRRFIFLKSFVRLRPACCFLLGKCLAASTCTFSFLARVPAPWKFLTWQEPPPSRHAVTAHVFQIFLFFENESRALFFLRLLVHVLSPWGIFLWIYQRLSWLTWMDDGVAVGFLLRASEPYAKLDIIIRGLWPLSKLFGCPQNAMKSRQRLWPSRKTRER